MTFHSLRQAVLVGTFITGIGFSVTSSDDFQQAHDLLQALHTDRTQTTSDASTKARLADEVTSVPTKVQRLINEGIVSFLSSDVPPSFEELRQQLEAALQVGPPEPGNEAEAFVSPLPGQSGPSYVIAYNISYCAACSRSWIGIAARRNGHFEIVTSLDDPLPNQSLALVPLAADANGNRFLVFGTLWGDAHTRMNAVAYRFDGNHLLAIWSRTDLPSGKMEAKNGELTLSFLSALRPPAKERTEIYLVTPNGIQLEQSFEHEE
jgi:hypothetical protein